MALTAEQVTAADLQRLSRSAVVCSHHIIPVMLPLLLELRMDATFSGQLETLQLEKLVLRELALQDGCVHEEDAAAPSQDGQVVHSSLVHLVLLFLLLGLGILQIFLDTNMPVSVTSWSHH